MRGPARESFPDPVDLPDGIWHGGATAYQAHKCRCRHCAHWRTWYDQVRELKQRVARLTDRRTALRYLEHRNVFLGPSELRRNPMILARFVANHYGDDLTRWEE